MERCFYSNSGWHEGSIGAVLVFQHLHKQHSLLYLSSYAYSVSVLFALRHTLSLAFVSTFPFRPILSFIGHFKNTMVHIVLRARPPA